MYSYDTLDYLGCDPHLDAVNGYLNGVAESLSLSWYDYQLLMFVRPLPSKGDILEAIRDIVCTPAFDADPSVDLTEQRREILRLAPVAGDPLEVFGTRFIAYLKMVGAERSASTVVRGFYRILGLADELVGVQRVVAEPEGWILGQPGTEFVIFRKSKDPLLLHLGSTV
jgi:hypothetical protein